MKKIAFVLSFSTLLLANIYTKENRVQDMQDMERSMSIIESGILHNNSEKVKKGTLSLSQAINKIKPPLEEKEKNDPTAQLLNYKIVFTNKRVKSITEKSKVILERLVSGDAMSATQAYSHVMKQCMLCHQQARVW